MTDITPYPDLKTGMNIENILNPKPVKRYDRHNQAKLKILAGCHLLESKGSVINSVRLANMTGKTVHQVLCILSHLTKFPYLREEIDRKKTDGCVKKYRILKQGRSVYKKLLIRFEQGLDLNLREKDPHPVEFYPTSAKAPRAAEEV